MTTHVLQPDPTTSGSLGSRAVSAFPVDVTMEDATPIIAASDLPPTHPHTLTEWELKSIAIHMSHPPEKPHFEVVELIYAVFKSPLGWPSLPDHFGSMAGFSDAIDQVYLQAGKPGPGLMTALRQLVDGALRQYIVSASQCLP